MKADKVKKKLTLILGSGFSRGAGLPTTTELSNNFLITPDKTVLTHQLEEGMSKILEKFWERAFNYKAGIIHPSLEDHFTLLDLAANSGHHLGKYYSPKRLRAIRRMSIHRVFSLVTFGRKRREFIRKMLFSLNRHFNLSIISLNWDIVVERHLEKYSKRPRIPFHYPIETFGLTGTHKNIPWPHNGIPLMKMHGSTNWVYCDSCRRLYAGRVASTALNRKTFLEADDFKLFPNVMNETQVNRLFREIKNKRDCIHCGNKIAGRVATFSYRKAFSIAQFQAIWERAHAHLREADIWLIVGYSLPEADFEFLHLLKSAQLGRKKPNKLKIEVITSGNKMTVNRYISFFGLNTRAIHTGGLSRWIENKLSEYTEANA